MEIGQTAALQQDSQVSDHQPDVKSMLLASAKQLADLLRTKKKVLRVDVLLSLNVRGEKENAIPVNAAAAG